MDLLDAAIGRGSEQTMYFNVFIAGFIENLIVFLRAKKPNSRRKRGEREKNGLNLEKAWHWHLDNRTVWNRLKFASEAIGKTRRRRRAK